VLTCEFMPGGSIDKASLLGQEARDRVARLILLVTIRELFTWRFMQTDPNWGNFLYDEKSGRLALVDFGASREFRKEFVDNYIQLVWAAANRDSGLMMKVRMRRWGGLHAWKQGFSSSVIGLRRPRPKSSRTQHDHRAMHP
jgi:aarF domain-containing kinase